MKLFANCTTFAILTDDDSYNEWFTRVLEHHWTVRPFRLIQRSQLDSLVLSDRNFFLYAQTRDEKGAGMRLAGKADFDAQKELVYVLSQGGHKQAKYLFTTALSGPRILSAFRYAPARAAETAGPWEAEMLIAYLNQSLELILKHQIKGAVRDSVRDRICRNAPRIADKTMLFNESYTDGTIMLEKKVLMSEKVIKDYPYRYQMVNRYSIGTKFQDAQLNPCYLFLYFPSQYVNQVDDGGDILVYDPIEKTFLYAEDNYGGPWFEKWELKDMLYLVR